MNPPTAEATRAAEPAPATIIEPEFVATFQDETGTRTPITRDCVEVIFVQDRPHFNHCIVSLEGQAEKTFLIPSAATMEQLLEARVPFREVDNIPVDAIKLYADFKSKQLGSESLPELITV